MDTKAKVKTPEETVAEHGKAVTVSHRKMDGGKWKTVSRHEDGYMRTAMSRNAKEAFSEGGKLSWVDTKRRPHPSQQGSFNSQHDIKSPEFA
jgi:hypothetical protein